MSLVALPPELRSICRKLTAVKVEQLPILLPTLLKDLQRCQGPLSEPQESKSSANSSEAAVLVHKLRTQISALLNGRSIEGHFAAVALIKTYIEAGGWETLRTSEPWVRGLVSILQKRDPMATKELCVVTLTKIYALAQKYQTLVREIVTPSISTFATACIQILKPANSNKTAVKAPLNFTETIFEAFSILIPLYPTTLRPYVGQLRSVTRIYLSPTSSDALLVPRSLQSSSRRLVTRLHMTAAKNGGADEWTKHVKELIKEFHETADQVFRAIQENWEPTTGYIRQPTSFDAEATGGGDSQEQSPPWTGIAAGSERMIGLLGCLADYLRCATKVAVSIPISALIDLATRVSLIIPPTPGKDKNEIAQMNPTAGREEKDDLWTVFPDIQVATLQFVLVLVQRLGANYTPLAQETLEQVIRTVDSGYRIPEIRKITFAITAELLQLCGPTMSKAQVDALYLVSMISCRDLLGAAGHIKVPKQQTLTAQNGTKAKSATQNADAFLKSNAEDESVSVSLDAEHLASAELLLTTLFSHLPQHHINPDLRSRMLRTAILCQIKDAEIASILHPAKDKNGRTAQVILPYLHQQFPRDEVVEILRFNFRPITGGKKGDIMDMADEMEIETEEAPEKPTNGFTFDRPFQVSSSFATTGAAGATTAAEEPVVGRTAPSAPGIAAEIQPSPFLPQPFMQGAAVPAVNPVAANTIPLKRKSEDPESLVASKRVDAANVATPDPGFGVLGSLVEDTLAMVPAPVTKVEDKMEEDGESDEESVHLNMDLDSDGDEDE
ncbi:rRNA processing/ribosome biogenesis-domain-containing protein [Truncatella angustata]|uniref:Pre-rRNA-processing protein RIX1 n=1 Tax=Truncatella angustata TaxID=152316 RepID=A0A9P8UZL0_9PEZI|nr:rRNA processing/ribosome biogenesis-domain-containing protein [Truncatella angustata]KAH6661073.1 rRNA processing/ribosome biogenesis-domain-containing protein [Truncatella angustata]